MITFIIALAALVIGYFFYGRFVERVLGYDFSKPTPAISHPDGVDYLPLPTWKVYMIQQSSALPVTCGLSSVPSLPARCMISWRR